jgi:hypothetical protein
LGAAKAPGFPFQFTKLGFGLFLHFLGLEKPQKMQKASRQVWLISTAIPAPLRAWINFLPSVSPWLKPWATNVAEPTALMHAKTTTQE